jgi:hypothetical protein
MSDQNKDEKETTPAPDTHSKDAPKTGTDDKKKS